MANTQQLQSQLSKLQKDLTAETDKLVVTEKELASLKTTFVEIKDDRDRLQNELQHTKELLLKQKEARAAEAQISLTELAMLTIQALPLVRNSLGITMKPEEVEMIMAKEIPAAAKAVRTTLDHLAGLSIKEMQ